MQNVHLEIEGVQVVYKVIIDQRHWLFLKNYVTSEGAFSYKIEQVRVGTLQLSSNHLPPLTPVRRAPFDPSESAF